MTQEEKAKRYDEAIEIAKKINNEHKAQPFDVMLKVFPELKESKDERIELLNYLHDVHDDDEERARWIAWLEKQGKQKEINLVEILKHYPRETELYSPLYGKLWLAEVVEEYEIIICYKHQLGEGCVRAKLEQEDTVSFYSDGTTGLPDFSVSKDCMLFLYDIEKQDTKVSVYRDILFKIATILSQYEDKDDSPLEKIRSIMIDGTICSMDLESKNKKKDEQKPTDEEMKILLQTEYEKGKADALQEQRKEWTAEDLLNRNQIADILQEYNRNDLIKWLEKQGEKGTNGNERKIPNSVWSEEDENKVTLFMQLTEGCDNEDELADWLKSLRPQSQWKPSDEQMSALSKAIAFVFDSNSDVKHSLESLYNELKKL